MYASVCIYPRLSTYCGCSSLQSHSIVPTKDDEWPTLETLLEFRTRVRARLLKIYEDVDADTLTLNRKIGRVLFMTYEHEALHLEVFILLVQVHVANMN